MTDSLRLQDIQGHSLLVNLMQRLLRAQRLPQVLLFEGPSGCGRRHLARSLAAAVLCPHALPEGDACGRCESCLMCQAGVHPDCHLLADDREMPQVAVELIREQVASAASESSLKGRGRVFIIPAVERLQRPRPLAANALLKVMEEAPGQTRIFMTTTQAGSLLPTIRSRVQTFRMQALSQEDLVAVLCAQGRERSDTEEQARAAQGSLRQLGSQRAQVPVHEITGLIGSGYQAEAIADLMTRLNREAESQAGSTPAARQRESLRQWIMTTIESLRQRLSDHHASAVISQIEALLQAQHDLQVNIQPRLVLEGLALVQ